MKTNSKSVALVVALALATGGSFALAQSTTPKVYTPANTPQVSTVRGAGGTASPTAGPRRGGAPEQPNMVRAYIALQEAKRALEDAVPDKGGFREKAIASVDQAIKDVGAGVEYAKTHPEEFRGARGAPGPRGSASTRGVTTPGGQAPQGAAPGGVTPGPG